MVPSSYDGRPRACPVWCVSKHGLYQGEDDQIHVSAALLVRRTALRLCATIDPITATQDGPYVLVGSDEFTLYEADALIAALSQLVDQGMGVTPR